MPVSTEHPTTEQLRAFHCGKLRGPEADAVEQHLAGCDACLGFLRAAPDDSMLELARLASATILPAGESTHPPVGPEIDPDVRTVTVAGFAPLQSPPPPPAVPPELVDHPRYRVIRVLGHGGMGVVYLAEHLRMERRVALKVIRSCYLHSGAAVPRFHQEVRAAARLDHPNIVRAFDADEAGGLHFLVMEYIDGTDLAKVLRARGPLPVAEACEYARQAALGLQHAHEHGMVHRDIKPHNLVVTPRGVVKILDFGLAGFAGETALPGGEAAPAQAADTDQSQLTVPGAAMGTADYVAPEQARDAHAVDTRADVYSLGCTLYHLIAGRVPFERGSVTDKMVRHAADAPPPLPLLPPGLAAVIDKMTAKDPADRYRTPGEAAEALRPFARPEPCARERRFRWAVAAAVAFCALAALLAAAVVYRIQTDEGEVVVTAHSDDVEVAFSKGGKEITVLDTKTRKKLTLPAGEYDVAVKNKPGEFAVTTNKLTVYRGKETLVSVEYRPKGAAADKAVPPTAPTPADKEKALALLAEAQATLDKQDYAAAVRLSTEVLKLDPGLNAARGVRGEALGSEGLWEQALTDLDEAVRRNPRDGRACLNRGWVLLNLDRYKESIAESDRAAEIGFDWPIRYANRGYAYALLGDFDKALTDHDEYVRRAPHDARVRWIRGTIHEHVGNARAAAADYAEALRLDPKVRDRVGRVKALPPPPAAKPGFLRTIRIPASELAVGALLAPDGRHVVAAQQGPGMTNARVLVFETATGRRVRTLETPALWFTSYAFLPDGRLATANEEVGGRKFAFRVWDLTTGTVEALDKIPVQDLWVGGVVASPDGKTLAFGHYGAGAVARVLLYEIATGKELLRVEPADGEQLFGPARFTPDGKSLVTLTKLTDEGDEVRYRFRFHPITGGSERDLTVTGWTDSSVGFTPDGKFLVVPRYEKGKGYAAEFFDTATLKPVRVQPFGPTDGLDSVRISGDGRFGVLVNDDGAVRGYDLRDGKEVFASAAAFEPGSVYFSSNGTTMALLNARSISLFRLPAAGK